MYKSVIDFREDISKNKLEELIKRAEKAFDNRAGKVQNVSKMPYRLSYEGGEEYFGCLELGMLTLEDEKDFVACVKSWQWIDEEHPGESCDILEEMAIPVN